MFGVYFWGLCSIPQAALEEVEARKVDLDAALAVAAAFVALKDRKPNHLISCDLPAMGGPTIESSGDR